MLGALVTAVLGVALHDRRGTHVDSVVLKYLHADVTGGWVRVTLDASIPAISVVLLVIVFVAAVLARQARVAVLVVAGPASASALTQYLLKPWVNRHYGAGLIPSPVVSLSYPSGHETLVASAALVTMVAIWRLSSVRSLRALAAFVLIVWTVMAGVGLVVNFWHYTTDIVGAVGVCVAVVLGEALLLDGVSSPGARDRPRRTHGV